MGMPANYVAAIEAFKAKNWKNGTANGLTEAQNRAAVLNQPGNSQINNPANQATLAQAKADTAAQSGGGFVPVGKLGDGSGGSGDSTNTTVAGTPAQGNASAQDYINQLEAARQQAAIAALGKSRDASLSDLSAESAKIAPQYYAARNTAAAGGQQQARNFAEYMANRGGASAGSNIQATLMNNMQTQGNLGALNQQEQAANNDIARRTTDINNAYNSDVASTTAGIEADKLQSLLQDYYSAQQRGDTLGQQQIQNQLAQAQFGLQQQGQQFNQGLATNQNNFNQNLQTQQLNMDQQKIDQAGQQFAANNKLDWAKMSLDQKQILGQLAISQQQANISQQNADTSSSNAAYAQDPNNPDNQYKMAQLNQLKNGTSADTSKELDGLYTGLTSGQITPGAAIEEINGKVKAGILTQADADKMLKLVTTVNQSMPKPSTVPTLTQDQIDANGGQNPQDLNADQLYKLWTTDPTGEKAGTPSMDWASWYKDPRGRIGGVPFKTWASLYGPQLTAG